MTVRLSSIVFLTISLLLSVVFPIVATVVLHVKLRFAWKSVFVGILVFLVFQLLTRIPVLTYLKKTAQYAALSITSPVSLILLVAFSAGLFEETGRYIGFRFLLRDFQDWRSGIAYGLGHGGLESLYIGITGFLKYVIFSVMVNTGRTSSVPASAISALTSAAPPTLVVGGIERVLALIVQIGMSLVVVYGIRTHKPAFFLLAIVLHTLLDFGALLLASAGVLFSELYLAVFAAVSLAWVFLSKKLFAQREEPVLQQN